MKTVFVNRFYYPDHSATSQILSDLTFKCAAWGYDVTVVASRQRYDDPSAPLPVHERVDGVEVFRVGGTSFGRRSGPGRLVDYVTFLYRARAKVKQLAGPRTVVVAKTDPPMLGMFLTSVVRRRGGVVVNWLQDLFPETLTALMANHAVYAAFAPLQYLRNRALRKALVNIVVARKTRDYLVSEGIRTTRLRVIHNWPLDDSGGASSPEGDVKAKWNLSGRVVVGYFGNLGKAHEYETILGAMMALDSDPSIVFLFVGGGSGLEKLKAVVAEHGLKNFVHRDYVPREELAGALRVADVHLVVLQPRLEGFVVPSKFAGVVAAGRPVLYVGDRTGEIGSMVRKEGCGRVVAIGDSQGLASQIRALAKDPDSAARMGQAAYRLYQKRFRSELLLGRWKQILGEVEKYIS